ncbi:hypothetical protein F2Q68_00044618 [Brassica cretica]|uniref:Uncharacterized protein n=1 Tax=Brassica cretica TaxID=69181 RepID=A0A8S9LKR1_BRACR|nr:hypothetical protein F2Q68_00044618 [Brassica cretica]
MKMTSYALCSTPTTPHTGRGHDLQLTDRDTPCSSKHIEAPCSLQHIDYSTICSGHASPRTDGSYHLQSHMLIRPCAQQGHVPIQAPCLHQSYGPTLESGPSIADPEDPAIFATDRRLALEGGAVIYYVMMVIGGRDITSIPSEYFNPNHLGARNDELPTGSYWFLLVLGPILRSDFLQSLIPAGSGIRSLKTNIPGSEKELEAQKGLKVKNPQGPKKRPKGPRHRGPAKSLKDRRFPGNSAPKVHELLDDLKISCSSSPGPIRDFEKFISRYSGSQSQGQCDILAQTTLKNQRQELLKEPRVIWSRRSEPITRPRDLKDSKFKRPREEG